MTITRIADATIEPATRQDITLKGDEYQIGDICMDVMRVYEQRNYQVKDFAPYLQGESLKDTCRNIWHFVRKNIAYNKDPRGDQWIRRPSRLWADKEGDCKSYSVFIASCLRWLGINGVFRFVSYDPLDEMPVHVYIVVPDGEKEIVIDCVPQIKYFGQEAAYTTKYDYSMGRLKELAGIEDTIDARTMHTLQLMAALVNERQIEADKNGGWITEDRDALYQQQFAKLQQQLHVNAIGDVNGDALAELASFTGIPGAGTFTKILTGILGNKPNPNDWRNWTPGDVKQWTVNNGDSVQNEATNIISYINAHGLKDIIDSDAYGRDRVTIQQIAQKLIAGGFPEQANTLLESTQRPSETGQLTKTVDDLTKTTKKNKNNTLLLVAGAAVVGYFIMKK